MYIPCRIFAPFILYLTQHMLFQMPCVSHLFHSHQPFLVVCRMLNAYPPPSAPPPQNIPIIAGGDGRWRPWWVNVRNGYVSSPQTITNQYSDFPPNHSLPRDNNLSLILSHFAAGYSFSWRSLHFTSGWPPFY